MLDNLFKGIFDTDLTVVVSPEKFLLCVGCALLCGIILTLCYVFKAKYTYSFAATLAMLPSVVAVVIMMVNGNVGTGVAVAGAFSLVRFRSVPGTAKEIGAIFIAMGVGLVIGTGYLGYALLVSILLGAVGLLYNYVGLQLHKRCSHHKILRVTIPEDLDYTNVFEDVFSEYTSEHELTQVKTTNMGSLFRLTYDITVKNIETEKELIDKLRVRNGNLEITISNREMSAAEL